MSGSLHQFIIINLKTKKMTLKHTASALLLSFSFLAISCGGESTETDATTEGTDSTTIVSSCDPGCDKNKGCSDECKKNCDDPSKCANSANSKHGEKADNTMEDGHACEEGACMPGACGGGE